MALNKESPSSIPVPPSLPDLYSSSIPNSKSEPNVTKGEVAPLKELYESCYQFLDHSPDILFYKFIEPILQEGPTCGIVALSMASSCTEKFVDVETIFTVAKRRQITNHGEMFSVANMAQLAREVLNLQIEEIRTGLKENEKKILEHLSRGSLLLVPYDADANHTPCLRRGHKAHWALVVGVLRAQDGQLLVCARQGKSRRLGLWAWEHLVASNANLEELGPARVDDGCNYVLPSGGVQAGLQHQAILLHLPS